MKQAIAYIRKSVLRKGSRTISPQVQEDEVRKLAERYGDTDLLVLGDLGKSGRKAENRPDYQRVLQMVEAGQVKAIYAYSMSRLCRSVKDYAALSELCVAKAVPVRLFKEGEQDYTTATGRLIAGVLSNIAAFVAELASEQAKETIAAKIANGEHHGALPYGTKDGEDVGVLVDAFREAGSYHGAARLLNERGAPTRLGGLWRGSTVRLLLLRYAPQVVPMGQAQRVKSAPRFRLARLLRCDCGRTMTGVMKGGYARYICQNDDPSHPLRKGIAESLILEWMKAEAGLLRAPEAVEMEAQDAERQALEDRLDKLSRQHEMGVLDDAQLATRAGEVQDALGRLQTASAILDLPDAIDWTWEPRVLNAVLRALWQYVQLDEQLQPVRAEWRVSEWRFAG